ncbi:MAG: glutathione S-transferase [Immundisolibacter sp.]
MIKFYTILPDNDDIGGARQATKVSIMLQEIGEEFETVDLDRRGYVRPRNSEYRKINPNGRVPAIDDDGFILWEAGTILQYLAETRPAGRPLLPASGKLRYEILKWVMWDGSTLTPDLVIACPLKVTQQRESFVAADMDAMLLAAGCAPVLLMGNDADKDRAAWKQAVDMLQWDYHVMNEALEGKHYFGGDTFTIADIALGVVTPIAFLLGIDVKQHPNVRDWLLRLAERQSFQNTYSFMDHMNAAERDGLL